MTTKDFQQLILSTSHVKVVAKDIIYRQWKPNNLLDNEFQLETKQNKRKMRNKLQNLNHG
jgi:hypothetical protein